MSILTLFSLGGDHEERGAAALARLVARPAWT